MLEQNKESPSNVIGSYWDKLYYGNHVYGNKVSGYISTVSKLNVDDIRDFYKTNYVPTFLLTANL